VFPVCLSARNFLDEKFNQFFLIISVWRNRKITKFKYYDRNDITKNKRQKVICSTQTSKKFRKIHEVDVSSSKIQDGGDKEYFSFSKFKTFYVVFCPKNWIAKRK
jgi:hypothetical protein